MMNQKTQKMNVAIIAPTFNSMFQTTICKELRNWLKRDEMALRTVTDNTDVQKEQLNTHPVRPRDLMQAVSGRPIPEMARKGLRNEPRLVRPNPRDAVVGHR